MEASQAPTDGSLREAEDRLAAMFGNEDALDMLDATEGEAPEPDEAGDEPDVTDEREEVEAPDESDPDDTEQEPEAVDEDDDEDEPVEEADDTSYDMPELLQVRETDDGHEFGLEIDGDFLSLDDVRRGVLREADYTQKTQAVADERRQAQAAAAQAAEARQQYLNGLTEVEDAVRAVTRDRTPEEWRRLRAENRDLYDVEHDAFEDAQAQLAALQQHRTQVEAEQAEAREAQRIAAAQECEDGLLKLVPEWADQSKMSKDVSDLVEYVETTYNVTAAERAQSLDPRTWDMARKAMLYDRIMAEGTTAQAKTKRKASPTLKAGRPATKREKTAKATRGYTAARKRLRATGNVKDATRALEELFKQQE